MSIFHPIQSRMEMKNQDSTLAGRKMGILPPNAIRQRVPVTR